MLNELRIYFKKKVKEGTVWRKILRRVYLIIKKGNPWYLLKFLIRRLFKTSIFFEKSELEMCSMLPIKKLSKTVELFQPNSILDLGCGTGKSLDYFYSRGIVVLGVEGSSLALKKALHPDLIIRYNLNNELNLKRSFDLIWSYEFVEHIHPKYLSNLLKTFSNHSDVIVLSAARPGHGGEGHFNEQPPEYWMEKFREYNYKLDAEKTRILRDINETLSGNMMVFYR